MPSPLVYPEVIDRTLAWPLGTACRLARRGKLPHYVLPDGAIRMRLEEIEPLVVRVPAALKNPNRQEVTVAS